MLQGSKTQKHTDQTQKRTHVRDRVWHFDERLLLPHSQRPCQLAQAQAALAGPAGNTKRHRGGRWVELKGSTARWDHNGYSRKGTRHMRNRQGQQQVGGCRTCGAITHNRWHHSLSLVDLPPLFQSVPPSRIHNTLPLSICISHASSLSPNEQEVCVLWRVCCSRCAEHGCFH